MESGLSRYDSLGDPHCGFTKTRGAQKQRKRAESSSSSTREERSRQKRRGHEEEPVIVKNLATKSGGVTFQRPSGTDPTRELEVLKCIVLRENYVERLKQLCGRDIVANQEIFTDLAELLRAITLEVIENIVKWRRGAPNGSQFFWNGINYLLRIPSDLDFMNKSNTIRGWLGTSAERNPFMVDRTLDESPIITGKDNGKLKVTNRGSGTRLVGGRDANKKRKRSTRGAPVNSRSTPYNTPVINDPSMQSSSRPIPSPQTAQRNKKASMEQEETVALTAPKEEVDMIKVLEAERILIQEEEMYGRYTRNDIGLLVPVELGKDEDNVHGTRTKNIPEQDESKHDPQDQHVVDRHRQSKRQKKGANRKDWPNGQYMMEKAKAGGDLNPLTKKSAAGRKQIPYKRSRAAQIELEIKRAKRDNKTMEQGLQKMMETLEQVRSELTVMEAEEKQENMMNMSSSLSRSKREKLAKESYVHKLEEQVERKQQELEHKQRLVERKEAIRNEFRKKQKEEQLRLRQETLKRKQVQAEAFSKHVDVDPGERDTNNAMGEEESKFLEEMDAIVDSSGGDLPLPMVLPENAAATQIQRVIRGFLGRIRFKRIFGIRSNAALHIQSFYRMLLGKWRARLIRLRLNSAIHIQRVFRGHLGRQKAWAIKYTKITRIASTKIQRSWRAFLGRRRAYHKRMLNAKGNEIMGVSGSVYQADFDELAKVKADAIEPHVLSLLQCVLILTARGTTPPVERIEQLINWKACKRAMRRPYLLKKIETLSEAARTGCLFLHSDRITAVQRHFHDPNLNSKSLAKIAVGARVTQLLLQWIHALIECQRIIPEFLEPGSETWPQWQAVLQSDDPEGLELWEPSETDYDSDRIDPENYVAPEVIRCRITRPRPLIVAISTDVPSGAKQLLCENLKRTLPGTFAHVAKEKFDVDILQEVLHGGQSILLDVDVGMGAKERNAFIRKLVVAKATLAPRPMFILVKGSSKNRGRRGLNRVATIMSNHNEDSSSLQSPRTFGNWPSAMLLEEDTLTGVNDEELDNASLKAYLEDKSSAEFILASPSSARQLHDLALIASPVEELVLLMEAIMVLLYPENRFSGPDETISSVSWEQAVPWLSMDQGVLAERFSKVEIDNVPEDNLAALESYFGHEKFPPNLEALKNMSGVPPIACTLLWWLQSSYFYAKEIMEQGGPPQQITKGTSEIFASVITVEDGITGFPVGYEPRQDRYPSKWNGELLLQSDGWKRAYVHLMSIALRDMKVYSASIRVPAHSSPMTHLTSVERNVLDAQNSRKRLIISVYRDPLAEALFFSGYDPETSCTYFCTVKENEVNLLLGPNSIEMRDPRTPPRNPIALYNRLLELLTLERPRQKLIGAPPLPYQLVLRRKKRRLLRFARKIENTISTITASEGAPGEILLDVFVAGTCSSYSVNVDPEMIKKICKATSSSRERRDLRSKQGLKMVHHLVDRISLKRGNFFRPTELVIGHGIVPGRKIFEASLPISGVKHIVSVHVASATKSMRVVTYHPSSSKRSEFLLSARARLQLLGSLNEGDRNVWLERMFSRLHLHKASSVSQFGRTMSGSSSSSSSSQIDDDKAAKEKVVVLDKSLFKLSNRVKSMDTPDENKLLLVEFCVSANEILIQGQDDDDFYEDEKDDDTKLSNFRNQQLQRESIDILAYDRVTSTRYCLALTQEQIEQILEDLKFEPHAEQTYIKLASCLRLTAENKLVAMHDGIVIKDALTKLPEKKKKEESDVPKMVQKSQQKQQPKPQMAPLPEVISAEIEVENLDVARSIPVAEPSSRPEGLLVYHHGHKIGERYVVFSVWRQGPPEAAANNRFNSEYVPSYGYILQAYDPSTREKTVLALLSVDDLRSAVGQRQELLDASREGDFIAFLLKERLFLEKHKKELTLCVMQSKLFGLEKITPLRTIEGEDLDANQRNDTIVILPDGKYKINDARGIKIGSIGFNVKILHETSVNLLEYFIFTIFEIGMGNLFEEQGGGRAPILRCFAYNPKRQTKTAGLVIEAPDVFEGIDGERELLDSSRRKDLLEKLLPIFRIKRSLDMDKNPDELTFPWAMVRKEKRFSSPPPFKIGDGGEETMRKLFSMATFSSNKVSIILTVQVVNGEHVWFSIYYPVFGQKTHFRLPDHEFTRSTIEACAMAGPEAHALAKELVLHLVKNRLIVRSYRFEDDTRVAMSAYLDGVSEELEKGFIADEIEVSMGTKQETVALEDSETIAQREKLHLMPDSISKELLARRVAKLSDIYCILTAHKLVTKDQNETVCGIHIRAYCPSISQQVSISVPSTTEDIEALKQEAIQHLEKVDIEFDGVENHMKIKIL